MLRSLGQGFSRLTSLTALNLSGSSGLWLDYSAAQHAHTAAAAASSQLPAASSSSSGSAAAARAALPQLLLPPLPHQQQHHLLPELARLARLHTLDMSNNRQLMVVPGCVSVLAGLAVLDVCGCGVRWLGDAVLDCGGLQQLLLRDNVLAELPEDISRLTNLKVRCYCTGQPCRPQPGLSSHRRRWAQVLPARGVVDVLSASVQMLHSHPASKRPPVLLHHWSWACVLS